MAAYDRHFDGWTWAKPRTARIWMAGSVPAARTICQEFSLAHGVRLWLSQAVMVGPDGDGGEGLLVELPNFPTATGGRALADQRALARRLTDYLARHLGVSEALVELPDGMEWYRRI